MRNHVNMSSVAVEWNDLPDGPPTILPQSGPFAPGSPAQSPLEHPNLEPLHKLVPFSTTKRWKRSRAPQATAPVPKLPFRSALGCVKK